MAAKDLAQLNDRNIMYVVNCTRPRYAPNYHEAIGFKYLRIELDDDGTVATANRIIKSVPAVVEFVKEARATSKSILFHCSAGCSRSPSVLLGYLMKGEQMSL